MTNKEQLQLIVDKLQYENRWVKPKDRHPSFPTNDGEHCVAQIGGLLVELLNTRESIGKYNRILDNFKKLDPRIQRLIDEEFGNLL